MTAHSTHEAVPGWLLYDGACGVCSRWVQRWRAGLGRLGLAVAPLQTPWVAERTGLPPDQLNADVRLLYNDGRLVSGPDVYRHILRRIWWGFPLYLVATSPGGRQIFDWSYRTFARHRHRISAQCGLQPVSLETDVNSRERTV